MLDKNEKNLYITIMTESERIELIRNAVATCTEVAPQFQGLLEELREEKLAEDLVVKHGLLEASDEEVKEEFVSLDAVESDKDDDDFDNDENLVDMSQVSGSLREIFGE
ncbi:MAG: hypothetical protein CL512_05755 [Actinobacteria bacterium]|nr:hypothetical protein [Actinomycetota bacterium]